MNLSATLNFFKLLTRPSLFLPHATIPTFDGLSVGVPALLQKANGDKYPNIKAVVLDKDNCFAEPKKNEIHKPYQELFNQLRQTFPGPRLLVVSNSAGSNDDADAEGAHVLEKATRIPVFRHSVKKPGCATDVYNHLRSIKPLGMTNPNQIAVIGDRLFTDVMMANMMGAWSIWVKDGVVKNDGFFSRWEKELPDKLRRSGVLPPPPIEQTDALGEEIKV